MIIYKSTIWEKQKNQRIVELKIHRVRNWKISWLGVKRSKIIMVKTKINILQQVNSIIKPNKYTKSNKTI